MDEIVSYYQEHLSENLRDAVGNDPTEALQRAATYFLYRYLEGDPDRDSDLRELLSIPLHPISLGVYFAGMAQSPTSEDDHSVDFVFAVDDFRFDDVLANPRSYADTAAKVAASIVRDDIENPTNRLNAFASRFGDFELDATVDRCNFYVKIMVPREIDQAAMRAVRDQLAKPIVEKGLSFELEFVYPSDVSEAIDSVDNPTDWVPRGSLRLFGNEKPYRFGKGEAFLATVSASSLNELYALYSKKGLFAANLRYYVKDKKIDPRITETIVGRPDEFAYLNNGIIIVCGACPIQDGTIELRDFSIVNGCQTTTLIGETDFHVDFPVVAKVIPIGEGDRLEFIARIAEASNSQKPIKARDLIANRKELRELKEQFRHGGMFLQLKRGDFPDKREFPDLWSRTKSETVAQLVFSALYQHPGYAKNGTSRLLSDKLRFSNIFGTRLSTEFYASLLKINYAYACYARKAKREGKAQGRVRGNTRLRVISTGNLLMAAVIGLYLKFRTVDGMKEVVQKKYILENSKDFFKSEEFQNLVGKADIGDHSLLGWEAERRYDEEGPAVLYPLFDDLVDNVLVKAYMNYSSMAAGASYSTFSKTDTIYYRDVAVFVWKYFRSKPVIPERCLATDIMVATRPDLSDPMLGAYPGLETELSMIGQEGVEGRGKSQPALTSMQIVSIVRYMPHDILALSTKCNLGQKAISAYGRHILRLVSKYESRGPEEIDDE